MSLGTVLLAAAVAAGAALALRPVRTLVAVPAGERWHHVATPMTGGIAIFVGFVVGLQPALLSDAVQRPYFPLVVGAAAAFALGLTDDRKGISVASKISIQAGIAVTAASLGLRPDWLPTAVAVPVAALLLVASMNSFNLLDNIDGLAAGTAAIAATGLALVGGLVPGSGSPVVAAGIAGACFGFLPFNYRRRRPAAVFMGNSGSHFLGFAIGGLALLASPRGIGGAAAAVAVPLLILAIPMMDTALVMAVRFAEGRPMWQGGRDHASHRLVYTGLSERRAVGTLLGITANCTLTAIALVIIDDVLLSVVAVGATLAVVLAFATRLAIVAEPGRAVISDDARRSTELKYAKAE